MRSHRSTRRNARGKTRSRKHGVKRSSTRQRRNRNTRRRRNTRRTHLGGSRIALTGAELYTAPTLPGVSGPYGGVFMDNELTDSVAGYRTFNTGMSSPSSDVSLAISTAAPATVIPPAGQS
jgi:hypothetical protein